ncbi:hypothetical protein, conserved [Trypanosoma cruzi]|uniref:Transmembrane protein n=1 Tax=Trypanosoma cruzi (strain CL Brener) TaxID=353153 RepID=Q4DRX9_TRYCC|nr:hypothetical protein, conserved [Trypanosoma cruzi]EAN95286.1 hypothetical protein, conserved [Trypanosoma cruzi]|eukprot:XP_817137.1 hypothetical protein [Trypanosoma cruzi strain CL Brener]
MTRVASQCFLTASHVLESRFTIHKDLPLISTSLDEEVDLFWRFVIICLWAFCIYMRGYDTILRGCSPIALETVILLLRVLLLGDDILIKREELMALPNGIGHIHRVHSAPGASVRNGALQQRQKERIGPRTAFALELFIWFLLIIFTIDLTNINRASVALFLVNTLYWARLGPTSVVFFVGIYVLMTYFCCPAYSLRDSFLTLSGQRSWVYRVYSSFGLAFSLTLFLTETQCLQRVRRAGLWKVLMIPRAFEKNVANTPLRGFSAVMRHLTNYLFFLGFNFYMALSVWFSSMMFEWTSDTSFTGIVCTPYALSAILGEGWTGDFQRMLREAIACLSMYLVIAIFIVLFVPTDSLSFAANGVSSAFFVLYMAAHSPRRVHSSFPLVMVWLGMVAVNAYWHVNRVGVNAMHMTWYKKLLCVNTITSGTLFMLSTALHVYRWEWPIDPSAAALTATINSVTRVSPSTRTDHKVKEKTNNSTSLMSNTVEKSAAIMSTPSTVSMPGKKASYSIEKVTSFALSLSSSSTSRPVENVASEVYPEASINATEPEKCDAMSGGSIRPSSSYQFDKPTTIAFDESVVTENFLCECAHEPRTNSAASEEEAEEEAQRQQEEEEEEEAAQYDDDDDYLPKLAASEEVLPTSPVMKKEKKEEKGEVQRDTSFEETSSAPLPSQPRRGNENENVLSSIAASDSLSKMEPLSQSLALSSPMQTSSSVSSEERRGSSAGKGKKTSERLAATEGGNWKRNKSHDRFAETVVDKIRSSENVSHSLQLVEKVVQPLPLRGTQQTSTQIPPESTTVSNKTSATASFSRRAALEPVVNARREHAPNKTSPSGKEPIAVSNQQLPSQVSAHRVTNTEFTGNKRQNGKKSSSRGDTTATEFKSQKTLPSQSKRSEDRRRGAETSAAARVAASTASASRLGLKPNNDQPSQGNKNVGGGGCVTAPQIRSAQNHLTSNFSSSLTVAALKSLTEEKKAWDGQQSSARDETDELSLHLRGKSTSGTKNKFNSRVSSQGDDDNSLDLAQLHLASLPESEPERSSSRRRGPTPTFEASRCIPQSTLHSLENFAKAYMPRLDTSGLRETERQGEAADGKDTQGGSSTAHLSPTTVKHVSLLEAAASAAASRSASGFGESRGAVPQQMMPQMFAMSAIRDAHGAAIYQQVTPALRPHVAATTQFDSHAMAMPQTASQQQIPVVLVAMGDGRLTYCPVVASSYSPAPHIMMQPQHMESAAMPQQHQQQGMVYQHVPISHPQQAYPGAWSHLSQQLNAPN